MVKLETSCYFVSVKNDVATSNCRAILEPYRVFIDRFDNVLDVIINAKSYSEEYEAEVVRVDYFSDGHTVETRVWYLDISNPL
jgi:hypothetical protein